MNLNGRLLRSNYFYTVKKQLVKTRKMDNSSRQSAVMQYSNTLARGHWKKIINP